MHAANRLEIAGEPGSIHVSSATYALLVGDSPHHHQDQPPRHQLLQHMDGGRWSSTAAGMQVGCRCSFRRLPLWLCVCLWELSCTSALALPYASWRGLPFSLARSPHAHSYAAADLWRQRSSGHLPRNACPVS